MVARQFILPAAWLLLLLSTASAAPALDNVAARQAANPTDPWVTVDESGIPKTITPVATTLSGRPTLLFAAPYEVTGTVFTTHHNGIKTTITGATRPVPTNKNGAGAFAACRNVDGEFKPFCLPKHNDIYYPGSTHFVTWDMSFFPGSNTTLKIFGFYTPNTTTLASSAGDGPPLDSNAEPYEEACSSANIPSGWGFYQLRLENSLLSSQHPSPTNITLYIAALPAQGRAKWYRGPTITLQKKPAPPAVKSKKPDAEALYIALPIVFGFSTVMIAGTYFWNRQARRIGIGNVMSHAARRGGSRRRLGSSISGIGTGGSGNRKKVKGYGLSTAGKGRNDRAKDQEQSIRLMDRDGRGGSEDDDEGWEQGWQREVPGQRDSEGSMGTEEDASRSGKRVFEGFHGKHR